MFLYTIQPPELILGQQQLPAYEYRQLHNSYLEGTHTPDGRFCVSRLISTDPRLYLNPRYAPGAALENEPPQAECTGST